MAVAKAPDCTSLLPKRVVHDIRLMQATEPSAALVTLS